MKDFKGEFQHSVFPSAVNIGFSQCVSGDGDKGAYHGGCHNGSHLVPSILAYDERHDDRTYAVSGKGNEHGKGVEEEITQKSADAADQESAPWIEGEGGNDDDDVIQVDVSAGNGDAERRKNGIDRHE